MEGCIDHLINCGYGVVDEDSMQDIVDHVKVYIGWIYDVIRKLKPIECPEFLKQEGFHESPDKYYKRIASQVPSFYMIKDGNIMKGMVVIKNNEMYIVVKENNPIVWKIDKNFIDTLVWLR